ncbi:MAG TPA: acyltransferase, partial [Saprospiraceae bacterium]|nr:acyltransferase [Saprospiraceae bacterium]
MPFTKLTKRPDSNVPVVDGIRALAILWVIFFHAWIIQVLDMPDYIIRIFDYPALNWVSKGDLGVDLFFVISGFLIGSIIFKEIQTTGTFIFRRFYFRRYLRLTPVYIFAIIVNMILTGNMAFGHYWSNILYINNYIPNTEMIWTWSLALEEQFYLLTPFLLLFLFPLFRQKLNFFALFTLISLALSSYYVFIKMHLSLPFNVSFPTPEWFNWFNNYYRVSHLRFVGLLSGVAAAYLHIYHAEGVTAFFRQKSKYTTPITIATLLVLFFISFTPLGEWTTIPKSIFYQLPPVIGKWYEVCNKAIFSYGMAYIILACLYGSGRVQETIKRFLSLKFFYPIAQLSYSAYLFHVMFMFWIFPKLFALWSSSMSPA